MTAFIVRRLLQAALVVVGVVTLVFFLIRVTGDPASLGVSLEENRTQEEIEAEYRRVQKQLGLDRHILIQYVLFWGRAARGDFGFSFRYSIPATQLIIDRLPNSLRLGFLAAIIGLVVGLPLGIVAALNRGSIIDNLATSISVFGIVVPQFWLGSVDIYIILSICQTSHYLQNGGQGYWSSLAASPACTLERKLIASGSSRLSSG